MTPEQEKHLESIKQEFTQLVDAKYRLGVLEHGGDLNKKRGVIDFAVEETLDLVVYLLTIKQQLKDKGIELGELEDDQPVCIHDFKTLDVLRSYCPKCDKYFEDNPYGFLGERKEISKKQAESCVKTTKESDDKLRPLFDKT